MRGVQKSEECRGQSHAHWLCKIKKKESEERRKKGKKNGMTETLIFANRETPDQCRP